ncbi:MAG: hypothetical protein JXK07_14390 [Spirochaetes bacterium]|nr:hypothetical protein [Spirochaetota bacterium]MBN2770183.1 hypothetical protein [Spirochaetota bacterium]
MKRISLLITTLILSAAMLFNVSCGEGSGSASSKTGEPQPSPSSSAEDDSVKEPAKGSDVTTSTPTDASSSSVITEETVVEEINTIVETEESTSDEETTEYNETASEESDNGTGEIASDNTGESDSSTDGAPTETELTSGSDTLAESDPENTDSTESDIAVNDSDGTTNSEADESDGTDIPEIPAVAETPAPAPSAEEILDEELPLIAADDDEPVTDDTSITDEAGIVLEDAQVVAEPSEGSEWFTVPDQPLDNPEYAALAEELEQLVERAEQIIKLIDKMPNEKARQAQIKRLEDIEQAIASIRNQIGYSDVQSGIYTASANQQLDLTVSGITEPGYYSLSVVAKNVFGTLPDNYGYFNLSVSDNSGSAAGNILVPASDKTYQKGSALVYLNPGTNNLKLKWTNDYYIEGSYDANIQIKSIMLNRTSASDRAQLAPYKDDLTRSALQYTSSSDGVFWTRDGALIYQSGNSISFNYPMLDKGRYQIVIWARNHGEIKSKPQFKRFEFDVYASTGESELVSVNAHHKNFKAGKGSMDISGGDTTIEITWINDGPEDVVLELKQIELKRIGDYQGSALSAYLLGTGSGNRLLIIILLIFFTSIGITLSIYHKRQCIRVRK